MNKNKSFALHIFLSFFVLAICFALSLLFGAQKISKENASLLISLRFPRAILATLSGILLAGSGTCFQMYFRNPLAEPGIIGISSGATLGAVIAQTFGINTVIFQTISSVNVAAFCTAIASGIVVTFLASKSKESSSPTILLCGIALGTFYSSISSIILLTKTKELHGIYTWILGSFNGRSWNELKFIILPSAISIFLFFICAQKLNLMAGGENSARSLGLNTAKLKIMLLLAVSFAVSSSVCAGGTINFVGLIAPHIVRKIYKIKTSNAKFFIAISMLYGAILLLVSDIFSRILIAPAEFPTGLITSLLGAPFFISLIFNSSSKRSSKMQKGGKTDE